jgi:hypothetical protein
VQICRRLGFYFIENHPGSTSDACMQVNIRKEREEILKNRSSESGEFYRFSSVCMKTAVRMCNESETEVQIKASSIRKIFDSSLCCTVFFPSQLT